MRRFRSLAEHPFELTFGLLFALVGAAVAFGGITPTSINALLPEWVVRVWGVVQVVAGLLVVVGIVIRYWRPALVLVGLRIERAGHIPFVAATTVYMAVAVAYAGTRALYAGALFLAFAVASGARAWATIVIERAINRARRPGDTG
ncbi:hypothetical protein [Acrocarpospora phusangensis]|uniref:hypothetical protein n=1 Tax=Acrocarpospora phusangensis TaxID=1070424 RepID=UPI00194E7198|nr:hypothetical protein [Acrocarpospora phusangensis]